MKSKNIKPLISILFIAFSINIFYSQTNNDFIKIKYKTFLLDEREEYGCFYYEENELITNSKYSLYYETPKDTTIQTLEFGEMNTHESDYKYTYYKDFSSKQIFYDRGFGTKKIIIDSTNLIKWTITTNNKSVMNYKCQEAIGNFRGRDYKAYFMKEIPISNGPFKFDGLPGIILKIESVDGSVNIEAYEIEVNENVKFNIKNPYTNKKTITWGEFKKFYKKRVEKVQSFMPEEGVSMSIPVGYIENFID